MNNIDKFILYLNESIKKLKKKSLLILSLFELVLTKSNHSIELNLSIVSLIMTF
jgi:hypothetical protein